VFYIYILSINNIFINIMGAYTYMSLIWQKKQSDALRFQQRMRAWEFRHQRKLVRVPHPQRPEKARKLGYKRKTGYVVYRIRVRRGGRHRPVSKGICYGKPRTAGVNKLKNERSLQAIAETRAGKQLGGLRVLNSYWVCQDAIFKYFEVIMVDIASSAIRNDSRINWIANSVHKHREARGLTSAGRKHRGLRSKGHKATKARPSRVAVWKNNNTVKFRRYR
jgi:large subunit ribosomal protein L15e